MRKSFKYLMIALCCSALLVGCSLLFEETKEIKKSFRKTTFFYPDNEVFVAVSQILREDGYSMKKENLKKGIIETSPKKNKGLFAKAFSGGLYRTTIDAYIQRVNPEKTLVMMSMKIEKQIIIRAEELESFEAKTTKHWEEVEVVEDQLNLLGNDTYESYFDRIERTVKKNRSGRLLPGTSFSYGGSLMQTGPSKPAKPKKAADSPKHSQAKETLPEGFEDLD